MKTTAQSKIRIAKEPRDLLAEQSNEAMATLEQLLQLQPHLRYQEVDVAERAIVQVRDNLIDQLRQENSEAEARRLRTKLERLNVAISLIVGVEYPAAGIQQQLLDQAYDALKEALADGSG
jgi:hypothetical protein